MRTRSGLWRGGISRSTLPIRPGIPAILALLVLLPVCVPPAAASTVRQVNLEELTRRADRIFSGRVLDVRVERDPALRQIVTRTTFAVARGARGDLPGRLTITTLGGRIDDSTQPRDPRRGSPADARGASSIRGMPTFRQGEEVVLFLYGDSRSGLTSPVGFGQGKFTVVRDKLGRRLAVNGFGNRNLFRGLSAGAEARLGTHARGRKDPAAIPADELLDLVEALLAATPAPPAGGAGGGSP